MASEAQILANRANAARSTGPRSVDGKARVSTNAMTHGGFAIKHGAFAMALLSDESKAAFQILRENYIAQYQPANLTERFLVARMALAVWRLNRLASLEARIVAAHHDAALHNKDWAHSIADAFRGLILPDQPDAEAPPPPDLTVIAHDPVAHAYIRDSEHGNTITKLARYQTSLERSYYRALHELERLRAG